MVSGKQYRQRTPGVRPALIAYRVLVCFCVAATLLSGESVPLKCKPMALLAVPAYDYLATNERPQRLEVQACPDGNVISAYGRGASSPRVVSKTFDGYIGQLVSIGHTLVVVMGSASTSHLWVFDFTATGPVLRAETATKEDVDIQPKEPHSIFISVCPIGQACTRLKFGD